MRERRMERKVGRGGIESSKYRDGYKVEVESEVEG